MRSVQRWQSAVARRRDPHAARSYRVARGPVLIRPWLPLKPLVALLSPLAMLAARLLDLHPAGRRLRPIRAAWALGGLLLSLSGTHIDVDSPRASIRIHILKDNADE